MKRLKMKSMRMAEAEQKLLETMMVLLRELLADWALWIGYERRSRRRTPEAKISVDIGDLKGEEV